jgi:hypothetical protein
VDLLSKDLRDHRVVLVFDAAQQLRSFLDDIAISPPDASGMGSLALAHGPVTWAVAGESLYQLREQLEPLVSADLPGPLLVYLPGRQEAEGRKVLLELIRAGTVFAIELVNRARGYLREHLEPEKVEQLLQRPDLTYREVAHALEQSGSEGFSLLKALFQQELKRSSPPENGELARAWLVNDQLDNAITTKNLCNELADLLKSRWNLGFPADEPVPQWRLRAQRALLLHEFLRDWQGDELTAFRKQALPSGKVAVETALQDIMRLRSEYSVAYAAIARAIEAELGLQELIAAERPGVLGSIDTFPCEEVFLLRSVEAFLASGDDVKAQELVAARQNSFWLVGLPSEPRQLERRAQWQLAEAASELGLEITAATALLPKTIASAEIWAATITNGAYRVDGLQRQMEELAAGLPTPDVAIAGGLEKLRQRYDQLLQQQTERFTQALESAGWSIPGLLPQQRIWTERVQLGAGRIVVLWVDSLRYEMGASLQERFASWSSDQLSELRLEAAQAALPPITYVGMAALLPGSERSFAVVDQAGSPASVVDGNPIGWGPDNKAKRLAHLQQRVPDAVVLNLVDVILGKEKDLIRLLVGSAPLVITSVGIDEAGERDRTDLLSNVRADMQREIDRIEQAVRKLARLPLDHPLERFLITSDHGHIHGPLREPAMRIAPPVGKVLKLERRCWVGHPASVPDPCVAIDPTSLGYGPEGATVVVPRGAGVFRAGGSLSYHHGGTSLQEVLIPVLSFRCPPAQPVVKEKKRKLTWPGELPEQITNRVVMVSLALPVDLLNQGQPRQVVIGAYDTATDELVARPIQAVGAQLDRDTDRITLTPGEQATIGLVLPQEVSASKLYLELCDAASNLVLHRSADLVVDLMS